MLLGACEEERSGGSIVWAFADGRESGKEVLLGNFRGGDEDVWGSSIISACFLLNPATGF